MRLISSCVVVEAAVVWLQAGQSLPQSEEYLPLVKKAADSFQFGKPRPQPPGPLDWGRREQLEQPMGLPPWYLYVLSGSSDVNGSWRFQTHVTWNWTARLPLSTTLVLQTGSLVAQPLSHVPTSWAVVLPSTLWCTLVHLLPIMMTSRPRDGPQRSWFLSWRSTRLTNVPPTTGKTSSDLNNLWNRTNDGTVTSTASRDQSRFLSETTHTQSCRTS